MLKKFIDRLSGFVMTAVGGISLIISLILSYSDIILPVDPAWIAVIVCGIPLLYLSLWRLVFNKGISKISSALLISIAMFAAIAIGDLFAAGEVAFIMAIGAILEEKTTQRAKKGLKKLIQLAPETARRLTNGKEELVPARKIKVGDIIRILPGESIPADGTIINGNTSIDQSVITGEYLPIDKKTNDAVFCGTLNCFGSIDISVSKTGENSTLQKLIQMVKDAENKKAPMQRIADKWASLLVPVALLIAVISYFITGDIIRTVTILVVFCPCALVLATPTAIMAAIGQATKHGVIIKSGEALEKMGKVDTVAFDKTGTLTLGKLQVSDVISFSPEYDKNTLIKFTASAENRSEHPLGKAIVAYALENNFSLTEVSVFHMEAGKGIYAKVDNHELFCGNEKYLSENNTDVPPIVKNTLKNLQNEGKASLLIAVDNICAGIIALTDIVRPDAKNIITELNKMNTLPVLLTGDNKKTAAYFAERVGINTFKSELLPEEKVSQLIRLKEKGMTVCMIGDGINDAPALKTADVGIAMGDMGSDITVDASDITLMNDDISKILYLKRLSNATVFTIKFSISLSLIINFFAIYLSLQGVLTPTTGALVHNAGSCLVVLIAALLYDRKFD